MGAKRFLKRTVRSAATYLFRALFEDGLKSLVRREIEDALDRDAMNVKRHLSRVARDDSAGWLAETVPLSLLKRDRYELYNFHGWRDCEHKAFLEWTEATGARTEYLAYTATPGPDWSGHQVAIRVVGYEKRSDR